MSYQCLSIRFPLKECEKVPIRARKFKLHQIQPISLHFNVYENKSDFRLTKKWDTAAIHYFQQLLNESTKVEAQLCSVEDNCMSVYLYLTTKDSVICANDELVVKKFARYAEESSTKKIEIGKGVVPLSQELQSSELQNGHAMLPLCQEQPKSVQSQVSTAASACTGLLFPAWSVLGLSPGIAIGNVEKTGAEMRSHNEETAVPHYKEESQPSGFKSENLFLQLGKVAPPSLAWEIENTALPLGKESPPSLAWEKGNTALPLGKEAPPSLAWEKGETVLPLGKESPPSLAWEKGNTTLPLGKGAPPSLALENGDASLPLGKESPPSLALEKGDAVLPLGKEAPPSLASEKGDSLLPLGKEAPPSLAWEKGDTALPLGKEAPPSLAWEKGDTALPLSKEAPPSLAWEKGQAALPLGKEAPPSLAWEKGDTALPLSKEAPPSLAWEKGNTALPLGKEAPPSLAWEKGDTALPLGKEAPPSLAWEKGDTALPLSKEAPPSLAWEKGQAALPLGKEAPPSLAWEKGDTALPLSKEAPPSLAWEKGQAALPLGKELPLSPYQEHKVPTSPGPLMSILDHGSRLTAGVPENTDVRIRLHIEENSDSPVQEELQSSETEACSPELIWPAWSNIDHRRRLSGEIREKSAGKISMRSDGRPTLTEECQEKQAFIKLVQCLNPTPEEELLEDYRKCTRKAQYPIFVSKSLISYSTLESATLYTDIKKRLLTTGYDGPNLTESYCWAPIAQGFDTIVITHKGSNPMCYVPPLLSFLNIASVAYKYLAAKHGPYAVIICPGWDKAHEVYKLLMDYSKCIRPISPMLLLVGLKKEEVESINLRKQCEVIVTTPNSLLRCLAHHGFLLLRLCHLILDEVDVLFSKAGPQMSVILETYKKMVSSENRDVTPQQIVAVGSTWHHDIELLLQYTTSPQVIITRMEQAAVFANVQQVLEMCLDCEKLSVFLQCLDVTPVNAEKVLIFTKSSEEAELVHKAVKANSIYCLLLHRNLMHNFNHVLEQWNKIYSRGTVVALVVTDDFAPIMEITDATCIIHWSFPENVGVLSLRLFSLLDYIQSKINKVTVDKEDYLRAKSVLLMTEKQACHAVELLNFLQQTQATIPPELLLLTHGISKAMDDIKSQRELCPYLKTLGYCIHDKFSCPDRHRINPALDLHSGVSPIPETSQYINVLPLCIVDATRFFGRIVTKSDPYDKLVAHLSDYYQSPINTLPKQKVVCKQLYAMKDDSTYHRVLVLSTKTVDNILYAHVQYIDDGKVDEVLGNNLLPLPPAFHMLPPQCMEFIVCRVKPIDNEDKWDPKVIRIISRNVRGKQHRAKVVLILGNTYWLDPMVQVSTLDGLPACVYELNVRLEILSTGLGTDNPQHVAQLQALLEPSGSSTEVRASDEQLTSLARNTDDHCVSAPPHLEVTDSDKQDYIPDDAEPPLNVSSPSLHPEILWCEKDDDLIITVKLRGITDYKCMFYRDRVVFSCEAGGKQYKADLELYKEIVEEKSKCSIKNGEPVISLKKSNVEIWNKFLKTKNPNVRFDFEHLEDSEENIWLPPHPKSSQKFYSAISEEMVSSEYSGSESD
ncbi:putative ATP-dependent RNA helicase TDRD12 isoform X2 [Pseudophryne corroboree]|uniref:putative ATP-dependent RNA helicase TDRD12 isoform X2 n=1 Tax=Pseudophryne corroboree TaxID=495146 RepID=UPI003081C5CF